MLISFKDDSDFVILKSLQAMGLILSGIASLYSQPAYRKVVADKLNTYEKSMNEYDKPYSSIYSGLGTSSHNKLNHMLKELNHIEHSVGGYYVTKAISKLGCMIMSDPYPSKHLMTIFDCLKDLKFSKDNIEVQLNLMETYKHALLKFTTNPFKSNLELKDLQNDAFIGLLKDFINDADIHTLIENILELTINDSNKGDSVSWLNHTHKMTYINKMYKNSGEKRSVEDSLLIKSAILSALECLDIIFEMIHTQITLEKKTEREKFAFVHQHHLSHLRIVQYIKEALLNSSSFVTDLDDNRLLLTIAAYIHFETRYACPRDHRVCPIDDHLGGVVNYDEYQNVSSIALK